MGRFPCGLHTNRSVPLLCGLSAALIPLKMEVREFVPILSILASYCSFPSQLSSYTVLADGCNYHEVRSVLVGFKSCTLGRNDACADASFVSRRHVWSSASTHLSELLCCFARIKTQYSSCSRRVYSLQWGVTFNWARLCAACSYFGGQRGRQSDQSFNLNKRCFVLGVMLKRVFFHNLN